MDFGVLHLNNGKIANTGRKSWNMHGSWLFWDSFLKFLYFLGGENSIPSTVYSTRPVYSMYQFWSILHLVVDIIYIMRTCKLLILLTNRGFWHFTLYTQWCIEEIPYRRSSVYTQWCIEVKTYIGSNVYKLQCIEGQASIHNYVYRFKRLHNQTSTQSNVYKLKR